MSFYLYPSTMIQAGRFLESRNRLENNIGMISLLMAIHKTSTSLLRLSQSFYLRKCIRLGFLLLVM